MYGYKWSLLTVGELSIDELLKILLSVLPIYAENICANILAALKNQCVSEHMIALKKFRYKWNKEM